MEKDKVLYIDDEVENLYSFRLVFGDLYQIITAQNVAKAFEIFAEHEIKVVISDQRMPEMTGLDFISKVREINKEVICMILTAYADIEIILKALNQGGVHRFILKPWNKAEMQFAIDNAIDNYKLKKKNKILVNNLKEKNNELASANNELQQITNALKKSEEKFRNIFNMISDNIIISDLNNNIIAVNNATAAFLGIEPDEITNKKIYDFISTESHKALKEIAKHLLIGQETPSIELKLINKNSKEIPFEINSKYIDFEGKKAILTILHDISERKQVQQKIFRSMLNAEEKERNRIAKEIHDGIGPLLSTSKIYIDAFETSKDEGRKSDAVHRLVQTIEDAINTVQEISNNISPHILRNFGLAEAIKSFFSRLSIIQEIGFMLDCNLNSRLDPDIETTLYRISIELINNSLKYSKCKTIAIDIQKNDNILTFNYSDDGQGFDIEKTMKEKRGMGINNVFNRSASINGKIKFTSSPGNGVNVNIQININNI